MGQQSFIDPQSIDTAAGQFDTAGTDLATTVGQVKAQLQGVGDSCGHDMYGEQFFQAYSGHATSMFDGATTLAEGLQRFGQKLAETAADFRTADSNAGVVEA